MNELILAISLMAEAHPNRPQPQIAKRIVMVAKHEPKESTRREQVALTKALQRIARCATGDMIFDEQLKLYVPKQKEGCR